MKTTFITDIKTETIKIPKDTDLTYVALLTKGWKESKTLNFNFQGKNSSLNFLALIIGKNDEKFTFTTNSNHSFSNTTAKYIVRSVMYNNSEIDYRGALNVEPKTKNVDTRLEHHTLLLSKTAKVKTTPSLEIESNDIKAGHAATIGHVNEDLLFYLTTRGLSPKTAKTLMIQGFLQTDLKQIKDEEIRNKITELTLTQLCP